MPIRSEYHTYRATGKFSPLVLDYLDDLPALGSFHQGLPDSDSLAAAIDRRRGFPTDRARLADVLNAQYERVKDCDFSRAQIDSLLSENTFTITTAHQCNLFTGPLYTLFKAIHAIRIADELNVRFPTCHFVPVFYLGSEDADLEELNHIHLGDETLVWQTDQKGAVGRMRVDEDLIRLIDRQADLLEPYPHGDEWIDRIRRAYTIGSTVAEASFRLLHELFSARGLLVLQPDQAALKETMKNIFWQELTIGFSHAATRRSVEELSALGYSPQAHARPINLFYLVDGSRERIERSGSEWLVVGVRKRWTEQSLSNELEQHPERFSPNVILRGLYQETILPNLLYVGGGAELSYWLQLKEVFDTCQVPFPLLQLRASIQWLGADVAERLNALKFTPEHLFRSVESLLDQRMDPSVRQRVDLADVELRMNAMYSELAQQAAAADPTLDRHVKALHAQAVNKLDTLTKKMIRAERRKMSEVRTQIESVQRTVFPGGGLQERRENGGLFISQYGMDYIDQLYKAIRPFGRDFTWLIEAH